MEQKANEKKKSCCNYSGLLKATLIEGSAAKYINGDVGFLNYIKSNTKI